MHTHTNNQSGNSFIDENHDELLSHLDSLTELLRDNWDFEIFSQEYSNFVSSLESHFSHEEMILRGAKFKNLESHKIKHRELSLKLLIGNMSDFGYDGAVQLLAKTRSAVFSHELLEDQNYWDIFNDNIGDFDEFVSWSTDLETGDKDTDEHHRALLKFIQRLDFNFRQTTDYEKVSNELKYLKNYSEFHFASEEKALGSGFKALHETNHKDLLVDLDSLIDEVKAKKFKLTNLGDYLKYWLINHIRDFDIPAFKKNL